MKVWELKAALEHMDDAMDVVVWREFGEDRDTLVTEGCFYCTCASPRRGMVLRVVDEQFVEMANEKHDLEEEVTNLEERVADLESEIEALKKKE